MKSNPVFRLIPVIILLVILIVSYCLLHNIHAVKLPVRGVSLWNWLYSNITLACSCAFSFVVFLQCKRRKIDLFPKTSVTLFVILQAALWSLLFQYNSLHHLSHFSFSIIFLAAFWMLAMFILGRFFLVAWSLVLFILLVIYGAQIKGILINRENLAELFATTWEDALSYISPLVCTIFVFLLIISIAATTLVYLTIRKENRWTLGFCGFLSTTTFLLGIRPVENNLQTGSSYVWPLGCMETTTFLSAEAIYFIRNASLMTSLLPSEDAAQASCNTIHENSGIICILHIGESLRADHCSINGYQRDTTPWLKSNPRLINFRDCVASAPTTDKATFTMLTNGRRDYTSTKDKKYLPNSPSIMDFFASLKFSCASFWSEGTYFHTGASVFNKQVRFFTRTTKDNFETPGAPWLQIDDISNYIDSKKGNPCNMFIIVNNRGSHAFFESFDTDNPPFTPVRIPSVDDNPQDNPEDATIYKNAYDCTVHYTDEYIKRIVSKLKGKPFVYIYMSDHGEFVGEDNYWTRGNAPHTAFFSTAACQVPFFIITSQEFENLHPHFRESLNLLKEHQDMSVAHEHLFHTILGLFNIQTPYYDSALDLCSPDVKAYTGPHPSRHGKAME